MISRRRFLTLSLCAGTGALLYATRWEPEWVRFVRRRMPITNLPNHLAGKTLVQLSDLHIGGAVDNEYLRRVFRQVARLEPDFVVYTGDFVTYHNGVKIDLMAQVMATAPHGRLGTVGVMGNHDYGYGWGQELVGKAIIKELDQLGIEILRNERRTYHGLDIVGIEEIWFPKFDLVYVQEIMTDPTRPTVALCHNPDGADYEMWGDYNGWILSGHTHGGQIKPPFLPAPFVPVNNLNYTAGLFNLHPNGRTLYINRGVGHSMLKARFNAPPEVTVFTLHQR